MLSEIVSIGTEILMGEITDTNSGYIAYHLPELGIEVKEVSIVGDDLDALCNVLARAWKRSDVTITTGGLGPTSDDLTREAIAQILGEEMTIDPKLLEWLEGVFKSRGMTMPQSNRKQATLIPSARPILNAVGTAPGWWVEKASRVMIAMPGPPNEMMLMWHNEVVPKLKAKSKGTAIVSRTIKTFGLSEAAVNEAIPSLFQSKNPFLGIYARPDGIFLRAIAKASTEEKARKLMEPMEKEIHQALKTYIWGYDNDSLEEQTGVILSQRKETLATMESFTGGLLASTITDVPGSSDYFKGGVVAYSNEVKIAHGVDPELIERYHSVSHQVAEAMAKAICKHLNTDAGIGTTGSAGPSSLEGHPPGTAFIGLAYKGRTKVVSGRYPPNRALVKKRGVTHALLEMVRLLRESK